jgi:hypothetical protein
MSIYIKTGAPIKRKYSRFEPQPLLEDVVPNLFHSITPNSFYEGPESANAETIIKSTTNIPVSFVKTTKFDATNNTVNFFYAPIQRYFNFNVPSSFCEKNEYEEYGVDYYGVSSMNEYKKYKFNTSKNKWEN